MSYEIALSKISDDRSKKVALVRVKGYIQTIVERPGLPYARKRSSEAFFIS